MDKKDVVHIYIDRQVQWDITQPWKRWNFAIYNIDKPGEYYA